MKLNTAIASINRDKDAILSFVPDFPLWLKLPGQTSSFMFRERQDWRLTVTARARRQARKLGLRSVKVHVLIAGHSLLRARA